MSEAPRGTSRRILVVDDVPDTAESLALLLGRRGHETRVAFDGPAALETARTFRPEIGLLDLGMPGMDGYELARRLREEWPDVLLVAVTGYRNAPDELEAVGFDHHLTKPVDLGRLAEIFASNAVGPAG